MYGFRFQKHKYKTLKFCFYSQIQNRKSEYFYILIFICILKFTKANANNCEH